MQTPSNAHSEYREKRPTPPFDLTLLVVAGVLTTLMAGMAVIGMSPETGMMLYFKAGVIALMAGGVSFAVNYYAVERGARLAATGYLLAAIFSVSTILIVGSGLTASTYAGMTIGSVNELRLHDYARQQVSYVGNRVKAASQATRTIPVIRAISSDLRSKVQCEIESACLSGRGGGRGPVTKALESVAQRSDQIAVQLEDGDKQRRSIIAALNRNLAAFQAALNDSALTHAKRRQALVAIDGKIDQTLSDLGEALPTPLLAAYARELAAGMTISARPEASAAASAVLANHGRALDSVLATLNADTQRPPVFPAQAGVSSTFSYIAHFLPIAAIVTVVELVLPLTLWVYTFLAIVWEKETVTKSAVQARTRPAPKAKHSRADVESPRGNVTQLDPTNKRRARRSNRHVGSHDGGVA